MNFSKSNPNFAVLLAGGSGNRMRGAVRDKCLEPLATLPVIAHSALAFARAGVVGTFVIVCRDDAQERAIAVALEDLFNNGTAGSALSRPALHFTRGGAERQDSVLNGLELCKKIRAATAGNVSAGDAAGDALVFIHDSARPLIRPENLRALADAAGTTGGAVLAHRVKDTIKKGDVLDDLDRSTLWAMETPQTFRLDAILAAYRRIAFNKLRITDDVAAAVQYGLTVTPVENPFPNPKITDPTDLALIEFLLVRHQ